MSANSPNLPPSSNEPFSAKSSPDVKPNDPRDSFGLEQPWKLWVNDQFTDMDEDLPEDVRPCIKPKECRAITNIG